MDESWVLKKVSPGMEYEVDLNKEGESSSSKGQLRKLDGADGTKVI